MDSKTITRNQPISVLIFTILLFLVSTSTIQAAQISVEKLKKEAEKALRKGNFENAEIGFRQWLVVEAQNPDALLGLGCALLKQSKLAQAYTVANEVIALDRKSARAYAVRGMALLGSGEVNQARHDFQFAVNINGKESMAIAGLSMIALYENRLMDSIQGFRRAIDLDGKEPDYFYYLTQAATRGKQYGIAAEALDRFLHLAPQTDEERRARMRGQVELLRFLGKQTRVYETVGEEKSSTTFEIVSNRPILKIRINGRKEPLRFVLDTGSHMTVISDEAAKRLKIKPVAKGGKGRGIGGYFNIVYGFLHQLEIGGARIEGLPIFIRPFIQDAFPVDGYLGTSAIAEFLTTVDYGAKQLILTRQTDKQAIQAQFDSVETGTVLRTTSNGLLSGEVKVEGFEQPLNFVIDTGATVSVLSQEIVEKSALKAFRTNEQANVLGAAGIEENVTTLSIPRLDFGGHVQENVRALVLNLRPINETSGFQQVGIIGGNVLRNFRVTFDFQRTLVLLEPTKALNSPVKQNQFFDIVAGIRF
ncbi:MAG: aspartyl protease family protein [Acidobacteriota bacterium]